LTQTELIPKRLDGKIAVITGGSSGLGLATARRFVAEGAYVFITGRRESELNAAVKQIGNALNDSSLATSIQLSVDGGMAQI